MNGPSPRPHGRAFSRRRIVQGGLALPALWAISGCSSLSMDPTQEGGSGGGAGGGSAGGLKEAPSLTKKVEAGKLPALAERMPAKPLVVQPVDRVGRFGGKWTCAMLDAADTSQLYRTVGYDQLLTWDRNFTAAEPNLAESIETLDDGRKYVVHLRPGTRWSDGEPFTARDIAFAFDDVISNTDISPVFPSWLTAGGKPCTFKVIDDVAIEFTFAEPHGWFQYYLAASEGEVLTIRPQHYLEKFHATYNTKVAVEAKEAGFASWGDYFLAKSDRWQSTGLPTLSAWEVTTPLGKGTEVVFERNPYYWKTDPDGAQLPYLDAVTFDVVSDTEVMLLNASRGEFSMLDRHINTPENKPVLAKNRESGTFDFFTKGALPNDMVISLNMNHADAELRKFFLDKNVRVALSHAINRQEIIDASFQRQGEPFQAAPRRESPLFDESFAKQFTEHDPEIANKLLDEAGYEKRDSAGYRLNGKGKRISFRIDMVLGLHPAWPSALQLVRAQWKKVGVAIQTNGIERSLYETRQTAGQHDASVWWVGGDGNSMLGAMLAADYYIPTWWFAPLWRRWHQKAGEPQEEPPADLKEQLDLYDRIRTVVDPAEQEEMFRQVLAGAKEDFYCIGIVALPPGYGIVRNDFHNVPEEMGESWRGVTPARSRPEQFFTGDS